MTPIQTVSQVFDAIQQAKAGSPDFCTNFFPVQRKIQEWIDHGELTAEYRDNAIFFFRKDRDFNHCYFCASSVSALKREVAAFPELKSSPVVLDVVGKETDLVAMIAFWKTTGFRQSPVHWNNRNRNDRVEVLRPSLERSTPFPAPGS